VIPRALPWASIGRAFGAVVDGRDTVAFFAGVAVRQSAISKLAMSSRCVALLPVLEEQQIPPLRFASVGMTTKEGLRSGRNDIKKGSFASVGMTTSERLRIGRNDSSITSRDEAADG
jgi:hypothetical protein